MLNYIPPTQKSASGGSKGVQFLKPDHVRAGVTATIKKVTTDKADNFGNPYVVYFEFGGVTYSKGYSPTSTALGSLIALLGQDEKKWNGKSVKLGVKTVDDQEQITYTK